MAPPYSLNNTSVVLHINAIPQIIQASEKAPSFLPNIQTANDITVFALQNSALSNTTLVSPHVAADYVVPGSVLYSTALTKPTSFLTAGKTRLFVTVNRDGDVFVNGSRIIESDIITANGVVHIIER